MRAETRMVKAMGREGQRRRSPRISALDSKENHRKRQLSKARTRMKRKLDDSGFAPVAKLAKQVWKGRDSPQNADHPTDFGVEWRSVCESQKHNDSAITNGNSTVLPAKHVLELVLDTLQRRDTYEVFAEPVDPDEVEDYYEIIKEPMDFGTMRAKLHEGMYENLEQFEHDVFLIPENAMRFNSSATVYFRQARAMHELAKKVFHVLKTDPGNFVSEFSGTRRRSMRRALSETKDSRFGIAKSAEVYSDQQCPATSTLRRMSRKTPVMTDHFHSTNLFTGSKNGRFSSTQVADRRSTYLYSDKNSVDPDFYSSCRHFVLMNQGDISYKDSLMSYIKGLGPTAQMVAKRKLLGHHESNKHRMIVAEKRPNPNSSTAKEFKTFRDFAPANTNPFLTASNTFRDFTPASTNPPLKASSNVVIDLTRDGEEREQEAKRRNPRQEKTETCHDRTKGKEKIDVPKRVAFSTRNPLPFGREVNRSSTKGNDKVKPVILALENSHSNVGEFKSKIKKNCIVAKPLMKARPVCDEAEQEQQQKRPPLPVVSHFAFDLSFLKARLSRMNAVEIGGKTRC